MENRVLREGEKLMASISLLLGKKWNLARKKWLRGGGFYVIMRLARGVRS